VPWRDGRPEAGPSGWQMMLGASARPGPCQSRRPAEGWPERLAKRPRGAARRSAGGL